jgi:hypothetical protein
VAHLTGVTLALLWREQETTPASRLPKTRNNASQPLAQTPASPLTSCEPGLERMRFHMVYSTQKEFADPEILSEGDQTFSFRIP